MAAYTSGSALDVQCLLDDGSLDPLFHGGHVVQVTFLQGTFQNLSAVRIDGGQVFVAGAFHDNSQGCIVPAVACLDGQGPVAAFGNAGLAEVAVPGGWATDLAIQPEEGVVLLGQGYVNSGNHSFLTQFSLNGSVVGCFGTGGMLVNSSSGYWNALATQSDGSIVVAGYSYASSSSMVQRFGSEGQGPEDPAGTAVAGDPALSAIPWSNVAIQADDSIVLAGPLYDGAANSLAVAQLASDGSVDTAFGDSGITGTVFQNSTYLNSPLFLRMSVDGDIAAGGYYYPNSSPAHYIDAAHYLDGLPVTVTAPARRLAGGRSRSRGGEHVERPGVVQRRQRHNLYRPYQFWRRLSVVVEPDGRQDLPGQPHLCDSGHISGDGYDYGLLRRRRHRNGAGEGGRRLAASQSGAGRRSE